MQEIQLKSGLKHLKKQILKFAIKINMLFITKSYYSINRILVTTFKLYYCICIFCSLYTLHLYSIIVFNFIFLYDKPFVLFNLLIQLINCQQVY